MRIREEALRNHQIRAFSILWRTYQKVRVDVLNNEITDVVDSALTV